MSSAFKAVLDCVSTDTNQCINNLCDKLNSVCIDGDNTYTCQCFHGYQGVYCDQGKDFFSRIFIFSCFIKFLFPFFVILKEIKKIEIGVGGGLLSF